MQVSGPYLYMVGYRGLLVIDVSNPGVPMQVGSYTSSDFNPSGLAIAGTYAFVGSGRELFVIDVSGPAHPTVVAALSIPSLAWQVAVAGRYAYVAGGAGLSILDVSSPTQPVLLGSHARSRADPSDIAVTGAQVVVTDRSGDVEIYDVSDPARPVSVGSYGESPSYPSGVAVSGDYVFVGARSAGLWVLRLAFARVLPTPTPIPPQLVGGHGLTLRNASPGRNVLTWGGGTAQVGYRIVSFSSALMFSLDLPSQTATYVDTIAYSGRLICYVLLLRAQSVILGNSDVLCIAQFTRSDTAVPSDFSIQLNQSSTATLTWRPPSDGAVDAYLLVPWGSLRSCSAHHLSAPHMP